MAGIEKPKQRPGLVVRDSENEAVVLDKEQDLVHQLNPTSAFIWQRCDGNHSVGEIAEELAETFDVDPETARRDVESAVDQLADLGLVEAAGS